jgi:hypothetical protein
MFYASWRVKKVHERAARPPPPPPATTTTTTTTAIGSHGTQVAVDSKRLRTRAELCNFALLDLDFVFPSQMPDHVIMSRGRTKTTLDEAAE